MGPHPQGQSVADALCAALDAALHSAWPAFDVSAGPVGVETCPGCPIALRPITNRATYQRPRSRCATTPRPWRATLGVGGGTRSGGSQDAVRFERGREVMYLLPHRPAEIS